MSPCRAARERRSAIVLFIAALAWALPAAADPIIYGSPAADGSIPSSPQEVVGGNQATVHLYLDSGDIASSPGEVCTNSGTGSESCAWSIEVIPDPGITLVSFTPAIAMVHNLTPTRLRANGLAAVDGLIGTVKLGDLVVDTTEQEGEALNLVSSEAVAANLEVVAIPSRQLLVLVPEPSPALLSAASLLTIMALARMRVREQQGGGSTASRP